MTPASSIGFGVLMFAGGVGIPIMAALSSVVGVRINSPVAAAFILLLVGLLVTGIALATVGLPTRTLFGTVPPYYFLAGLFVAFYLLSVTWAAPRIGVGNALFLAMFGQLICASIIDHFGMFGASATPISSERLSGLLFIGVGLFMTRVSD